MKYELRKIHQLSGYQASVYAIYLSDEQITLFDRFLYENNNSFKSELNDIISRLKVIGNETGAREHFFKLKEGYPGDGVCALYDHPESKLRLYCIRNGSTLVILGGGGPKPKNIRALQENPKLKMENGLMKRISSAISRRIKNKEIVITNNGRDYKGNLKFNEDEDE